MGRRHSGRGVLDKDRVKAVKTAIGKGRENAAVKVYAREKQGGHAKAAQDAIKLIVPETSQAGLADIQILRCLFNGRHRLRAPIALGQHKARADLVAVALVRAAIRAFVQHIGRQVRHIWPNRPIDVDDSANPAKCSAQRVDLGDDIRQSRDIRLP